jgi:hypothetical protein
MLTLLDLLALSIEEVTGRLKAVDDRDEALPTNSITSDGKLLFNEEKWLAHQKERKQQEGSSSSKDHRQQLYRQDKSGNGWAVGRAGGGGGGKARAGGGGECKATHDDVCYNYGHHDHWARDCRQSRHGGAAHMAQSKADGEPALFLTHASPVLQPRGEESKGEARASLHSYSTQSLTSSALLHIDEPCTHAFLGDGSDDDKLER